MASRLIHCVAPHTLCAVICSVAVGQGRTTLQQLEQAYQKKHAEMDTLGVRYTETLRSSIPEAELFRDFRVIIGPSNHYDAVQHRDGRYFCREDIGAAALDAQLFETLSAEFPRLRQEPDSLYTDVPFERVREAIAAIQIQRAPRVFIYDGGDVYQYSETEELTAEGVSRPIFIKVDPERLQGRFLPRVLWDEILLCAHIESLPGEQQYRAQQRIPDIFSTASFSIRPETELVGGAECLVVEAPDHHRIYVDPALDFAVKRRQWFWNGALAFEVICREFTEVAPEVWFPLELEKVTFGVEGQSPEEFVGKPIFHVTALVEHIAINRPEHLRLFQLDPPAGSWLVDETLRPVDDDGNPILNAGAANGDIPSVSYLVPADQSQLDEVISGAQRMRGQALLAEQRSHRLQWIAMILVPALLGAILLIVYRRYVAR